MKFSFLCLCVFVVITTSNLFAETLDTLDQKIQRANARITELSRSYEKEKLLNDARIQKAEVLRSSNQTEADRILKQAYASAEQLNLMNVNLNQWKQQKTGLCRQWNALYAKTIDDLLASAEVEKDKKKKGEIGKTLRRYQTRNLELCAESMKATIPQEWRSLRIETYDGPSEIQQKIQLLQEISREVNINLARLDQRYQDALREQKTKERAQEFIQESTLFTENVLVRPVTGSGGGSAVPSSVEVVGHSADSPGTGSSQAMSTIDPFNQEYGIELKAQYQKMRTDLLAQQKQLDEKIAEFHEAARNFQIP